MQKDNGGSVAGGKVMQLQAIDVGGLGENCLVLSRRRGDEEEDKQSLEMDFHEISWSQSESILNCPREAVFSLNESEHF